MSAAQNTTSIAGPAIAAILIALVGNAWALGCDALSFGISALFLFRVAVAPRQLPVRIGIWREIADGFRAVIERRWLGLQIASFAEFQLFILAAYSVLGPLVSQEHYAGATTWAIVTAVGGIGALVGDAISLRYRPRHPLVASNLICLLAVPLLIALAVIAPVPVVVVAGFLFGVGMSLSDTLWFTVLQNNVPDHLMARVSAFDWMGSLVLRPIGLAVIAPIAVLAGAAPVLVVAGAVTVATFGGILLSPSVRQLRAAEHVPPSTTPTPSPPPG
jgi:MFS family permease